MGFDYYQHEAKLTNLNPATEYSYDVFVGGVDATPSVTDKLTTAPGAGATSVKFVAFGDSGIGSSQQRQLAGVLTNDDFDLALHTGDVVYGSSNTSGGADYTQFHNWFFDIYRDWLRSRPTYLSIGNHDDRIAHGQAYRDLFVLPENGASAAYPDHAERYYSFDYGPVHFVALDTETALLDPTRRQEQLNWLAADLALTQQPWRVVFFHRSPYSSGTEHGSELDVRQAFRPILEQYGVQLALTAHDHDYERSVPWREGATGNQAVTYVVTGGGGARLNSVGQNAWTAFSRSDYHYVRATVSGCQLTLQAVGLNGAILDQHILDRCLQETDAAPPTVSITSPSAGANVSGTMIVDAVANDDARVEKVDLWIDGSLKLIDTTAPYRFSFNSLSLTDGPHTIEARAYDIGGNQASSGICTVIISKSPYAVCRVEAQDIVLFALSKPQNPVSPRKVTL
ncbi:MAG: Ig-like domain-containing protein [Pyrinomonadaceae bacterium]